MKKNGTTSLKTSGCAFIGWLSINHISKKTEQCTDKHDSERDGESSFIKNLMIFYK